MSSGVEILPGEGIRRGFIPGDEYQFRNQQVRPPRNGWRQLTSEEVERLVKNNNYAENWDEVLVSDPFSPRQIRNNRFFGLVRLGAVREAVAEYHDLRLPTGISDSTIINSDIGDDAAVHRVSYLAHYIVGTNCILFNLDEVHVSNHAKFGNGVVKEGEPEEVRIWLDVMNEGGNRRILPFDGMIAADAYLWARYRDDQPLMARLKELTAAHIDPRRGYYGVIGDGSVIKNSRILKDVAVGEQCYIKGANKLKNLTIRSSREEPTQIGEGVELVNGIIGCGCKVFYGCKAVRFIMGNNSSLKYGARLINSFLGDNSTISCCEVLNNLIFPAHEQHHNNSFLVASVIKGQSNIAAGATIGSNHNSRANDNEIEAGRGFWPGLSSSLKHSSRFATFILLAKGDYPAELIIPFPFSLVANNVHLNRLEIVPGYWWVHNMYALERNTWKFQSRDIRVLKRQNVEFHYLAPDSVEEIIAVLDLLKPWQDNSGEVVISGGAVDGGGVYERSSRPVVVRNPARGVTAYREMLVHYSVMTLLDEGFSPINEQAAWEESNVHRWVNVGGQLIREQDVDALRADIRAGVLGSWDDIHQRYDQLWAAYQQHRRDHAYRALAVWSGVAPQELTREHWRKAVHEEIRIQEQIAQRVRESRAKDFQNLFRMSTYRNTEEMHAVTGTLDENEFIRLAQESSAAAIAVLRKQERKQE